MLVESRADVWQVWREVCAKNLLIIYVPGPLLMHAVVLKHARICGAMWLLRR